MIYYLLQFQNYYNRKVVRFDTVKDYPTPLERFDTMNFNFNDGVNAEVILNYEGTPPNYMLVSEDGINVRSRWFVMDAVRERGGQFRIRLRRDLMSDFKEEVLDADTYIHKATLGRNNPLIFNRENMSYNQIKQGEKPIKDDTLSSWVVAYIKSETAEKKISIPESEESVDYDYQSFEEYQFNKYSSEPYKSDYLDFTAKIYFDDFLSFSGYQLGWDAKGEWKTPAWNAGNKWTDGVSAYESNNGFRWTGRRPQDLANESAQNAIKNIKTWKSNSYPYTGCHTSTATELFFKEDGKILKVADKYYKIRLDREELKNYADITSESPVYNDFKTVAQATGQANVDIINNPVGGYEYTCYTFKVRYEPYQVPSFTFTIPANHAHLQDAPFDILCFPYSPCYLGSGDVQTSQDLSLRIARELTIVLGELLIDIQLLPFCPLEEDSFLPRSDGGGIDLNYFSNEKNIRYQQITDTHGTTVQAVFYSIQSNFRRVIPYALTVPTDAIELKVKNETEFVRLVSPNYSSQFEFSVAKNNGVDYFIADFTYKPFTPYIRVAPSFKNLYGAEFGDARGLICGGDFSLPILSNAWINYEYQNKNYQNIFNRQIENLDFNNRFARLEQGLNSATSALGTGIASGTLFGPGVGLASGIASGIGGGIDFGILKARQSEQKDLMKDMFGYQLGNVKALPNNLTRVSAFNINNKIFPFIEFYDCTVEEKNALRQKLKFEGMTVGVISKISEFVKSDRLTYIQGEIIRIEIDDDAHVVSELADEIRKGVYI